MSNKEKIKVKSFLNKMWLKSIPVFINKENVGKEKNLAILYPVLRNFFSEQSFLKEVTSFCENSDMFHFSEKKKSYNPRHLIFQTSKNLLIYSQKKEESEHDLFMTRIMMTKENSMDVFILTIQQKEDFYEIILKEDNHVDDIKLSSPEELREKSFNSIRNIIKKNIIAKKPMVWRLQMIELQELAQEKVLRV